MHFHIAPDKDIQEHLRCYYELGLTDVKVTEALKQRYDTNRYGLRYVSMSLIMSISYNHQCFYCSKLRKEWDILSTRQQKHMQESIYDSVYEIRKRFPTRGAEGIRKTLRIDYGIRVPR